MEQDQVRAAAQQIWAKVLEMEVDDSTDFFEVGGHSFLAVRIIAMLDEALPVRTPVTVLFDNPRFDQFLTAVTDRVRVARLN